MSISNIHFDCAGVLLQQNLHSPSTELSFSFDGTCVLLRLYFRSPSIVLKLSLGFTEKLSPQRLHGEPSPSQRRRLGKSMTNLRQLVESKGTLQYIPKPPPSPPRGREGKAYVNANGIYPFVSSVPPSLFI